MLQISLLDEVVDADIAAIEAELLAPERPRTEIRHDPESGHCACGCQLRRIGGRLPSISMRYQLPPESR